MSTWKINTPRNITVTSEIGNLVLKAFYKKANEINFTQIIGVFEKAPDANIYTLTTSFAEEGEYIIRITDDSNQLKDLHENIYVSAFEKTVTDSLQNISSTQDVINNIVSEVPMLESIREELINITYGGLEISNNQLTIKDKSGLVIAIFDLFDQNGNPTMTAVYRREVVQ